jgi:arsenical pump membrane protein
MRQKGSPSALGPANTENAPLRLRQRIDPLHWSPVFAPVVLGLTLAGFALASFAAVNPAWAALAGALVLGGRALGRKQTTVPGLLSMTGPLFCLFVLALGIVVKAVIGNGLNTAAGHLLPRSTDLPAILALWAMLHAIGG